MSKNNISSQEFDITITETIQFRYTLNQHAIVRMTDVNGKFCIISEYSENEIIGENHGI